MSYTSIVSSNYLLKAGYEPKIIITKDGARAGFGKYNALYQTFEHPLPTEETEDGKFIVKPWVIDDTPIVFECRCNNKVKLTIHCTFTQLKYQNAPFIHLICFDKLKKIIDKNGLFRFIDDETGIELLICHKDQYEAKNG